MIPYMEFIINEIELEGHIYPKFFNYIRTKINLKYAERTSYYELILDSDKTFSHLTSNVSELNHARLNRWCFSISKSGTLNEIIKKVKAHLMVNVRELEIQYETKVSAYKPHQQTMKRFESARRFCFKYKALQNNNQIGVRLFRIINKMFDGFWE